ncbi:hypothetical protein BVC80_301g5 [Macleaya cordata]|uniref:Protein TILLER ANGLE CONTROL 1 n=1 Tax=Macleaya cordata TaxID=56857 RepID=A0A200Q1W2_MACCD|nr:hypothetical protein BVC80_301g5 [Macleaya cordata]
MKIFNWVNRKFHQNVDSYFVCPKKDGGLAPKVKKPETVTNETDTETLLDNVTLVDVLDGWKDGILTIGTFGFDPLTENEYSVNCEEEEKDVDEETEEEYSVGVQEEKPNPIVVKAFKQEFQKVIGSDLDTCISKADHLISTVDDAPLLRFLQSPQIRSDDVWIEKKKRTTLADLLSADSDDVVGKSDPDEGLKQSGKKQACRTKNGLSFAAKKLMPRKAEDSRPIKKLHRMVSKMLKKKIHPDLEGKIHVKEGSTIDGSKMVIGKGASGDVDGTIESVFLLKGSWIRAIVKNIDNREGITFNDAVWEVKIPS